MDDELDSKPSAPTLTDADAVPGLVRQRRFAVLMSLTAVAFYLLGGRIRDSAEYSGIAITLTAPERAEWLLWTVWLWAQLRFTQRAYALWSEVRRDVLHDVYAEDERIARKLAAADAIRQAKSGKISPELQNDPRLESEIVVEDSIEAMMVKGDNERRAANNPIPRTPVYLRRVDGGRTYPHFAADFSYATKDGRETIGQNFQMELSRSQVRSLRRQAWMAAMLRLPGLTEHFTPALLAIAAVVTAVVVQLAERPGLGGAELLLPFQ